MRLKPIYILPVGLSLICYLSGYAVGWFMHERSVLTREYRQVRTDLQAAKQSYRESRESADAAADGDHYYRRNVWKVSATAVQTAQREAEARYRSATPMAEPFEQWRLEAECAVRPCPICRMPTSQATARLADPERLTCPCCGIELERWPGGLSPRTHWLTVLDDKTIEQLTTNNSPTP